MPRITGQRIRFPSAGEEYDVLSEAVFRNDLERQLDRIAADVDGGNTILAFANADLTPSVARADFFSVVNSGAVTITAFDDGRVGQVVTLIFADGNTTIQDASVAGVIQLAGGANFTPTANDVLVLIFDGTNWYEISRSLN